MPAHFTRKSRRPTRTKESFARPRLLPRRPRARGRGLACTSASVSAARPSPPARAPLARGSSARAPRRRCSEAWAGGAAELRTLLRLGLGREGAAGLALASRPPRSRPRLGGRNPSARPARGRVTRTCRAGRARGRGCAGPAPGPRPARSAAPPAAFPGEAAGSDGRDEVSCLPLSPRLLWPRASFPAQQRPRARAGPAQVGGSGGRPGGWPRAAAKASGICWKVSPRPPPSSRRARALAGQSPPRFPSRPLPPCGCGRQEAARPLEAGPDQGLNSGVQFNERGNSGLFF